MRNHISALNGDDEARAAALLKGEVRRKTGAVLYSKEISGRIPFIIKGVTASAASQQALDYALDEAVRNLVADPAFMRAVLSTGNPTKPAASSTTLTPTPVMNR